MSCVFKINAMNIYFCKCKIIFYSSILLIISFILYSENALSNTKKPKFSINGSGLKIPRIVSLKKSLTYMRTGPGKEFPVKFELKQKGYPLKIIAEYNNWRKVITSNDTSGWVHTQLLSSFRTGLITKTTFLKKLPSNLSDSLAKLLPDLLINIKTCQDKWCKIEIEKSKVYIGWVQKENIWGSTKN